MGASGGYFIAAGSDWIVANRLTMTGSVGVIISTLNYKELFAKVGLDSEVYRSGDMKDMLNGARARRPDEMQYVQQLVNETFREFADVVAAGRERYETADDVINSSFGDGRILSGTHAAELGLVDQIGYFEDAVAKARELAGVFDAKVVRYRRALKLTDILFSMKAQKSLELRSVLPEEARSMKTGRMYFLAPTVAP
jgi:protease-4